MTLTFFHKYKYFSHFCSIIPKTRQNLETEGDLVHQDDPEVPVTCKYTIPTIEWQGFCLQYGESRVCRTQPGVSWRKHMCGKYTDILITEYVVQLVSFSQFAPLYNEASGFWVLSSISRCTTFLWRYFKPRLYLYITVCILGYDVFLNIVP